MDQGIPYAVNMAQSNGGVPHDISRVTVPEAAKALRISPDAVRNRLSRGTLDSVREDGRVFVLIDRDMARDTGDIWNGTPPEGPAAAIVDAKDETIRVLKDQLEAEREANRENRRIIAGLVQRVPELEAASAPRDSLGESR